MALPVPVVTSAIEAIARAVESKYDYERDRLFRCRFPGSLKLSKIGSFLGCHVRCSIFRLTHCQRSRISCAALPRRSYSVTPILLPYASG